MPTPAQVEYAMAIARLLKGFVKFFDNGNSNVAVTSKTIAPKRYRYAVNRILLWEKMIGIEF